MSTKIDNYDWASLFGELFVNCCEEYAEGNQDLGTWFDEEDEALLKAIGCKHREFFDFVEDCVQAEGYEPTPETVILVTAARRDYFLVEQKGVASTKFTPSAELPEKTAELEGYVWLPRIIVKAEAKLRGELDENTMFGCGGDRAFLSKLKIHPADFLRAVWAAHGDQKKILAYIEANKG